MIKHLFLSSIFFMLFIPVSGQSSAEAADLVPAWSNQAVATQNPAGKALKKKQVRKSRGFSFFNFGRKIFKKKKQKASNTWKSLFAASLVFFLLGILSFAAGIAALTTTGALGGLVAILISAWIISWGISSILLLAGFIAVLVESSRTEESPAPETTPAPE